MNGAKNPAMNSAVETALVIGASSDIGRAIAHKLAEEGCALQLAARDRRRLDREVRDIRVRMNVAVTSHRCDVLDEDGGVSLLDKLDPLPDLAVCVVGLLGDQAQCQRNADIAGRVMRTKLYRSRAADGRARRAFRASRQRRPGRRQLGGRRTRTGLELRLRLGQGGVHRVPLRSAQSAVRFRRPCGDRQTGLRAKRA